MTVVKLSPRVFFFEPDSYRCERDGSLCLEVRAPLEVLSSVESYSLVLFITFLDELNLVIDLVGMRTCFFTSLSMTPVMLGRVVWLTLEMMKAPVLLRLLVLFCYTADPLSFIFLPEELSDILGRFTPVDLRLLPGAGELIGH